MDEYQPILLRWFINSAHILKREAHHTICRNFEDLGRVFLPDFFHQPYITGFPREGAGVAPVLFLCGCFVFVKTYKFHENYVSLGSSWVLKII